MLYLLFSEGKPRPIVRAWVILLIVAVIAVALDPLVQRAWAQGPDACQEVFRDTRSLIIECAPGFATPRDRIVMYTRHGLSAETSWYDVLDFQDSVWIFDAGADGTANLVISFYPEGKALVADLYDDQDGDGQVGVILENDFPAIRETPYPTVRVVAPDGWWQSGDTINFNLDISVDGAVLAAFGSEGIQGRFKNDGIWDYFIHVRDLDVDGKPDYEWIQVWPYNDPTGWGFIRTQVFQNAHDDEYPMTGSLFWPFLSASGTQYRQCTVDKSYQRSIAPVLVDWQQGRIACFKELVASRWNEHNWFVYSLARLREDSPDTANWEAPFAFYDLAADHDGYPELEIRVAGWRANDPYFGGRFIQPVQFIRYSWDQDNNTSWDYKVDLVGRHAITTTIRLPEIAFYSIPYEQLPYWITDRAWDAAALVAVEQKQPYWTSEGIYEWDAKYSLRAEYVTGIGDMAPDEEYADIPVGFRGEYNFHLGAPPILYFSPVDHKLHLLDAEAGVWNIDGNTEVRYTNLDSDSYLDQWTYTRVITGTQAITTTRQLNAANTHLIYSDNEEVIIRQAQVKPSLFETLPPTNHGEWVALGEKLEANRRDFAPGDFEAMMAQFEGPEMRIDRAALRDFRPTDTGFRFVVTLESGFRAVTGIDWLGLQGLAAGEYAVTCDDGEFCVEPLTPAQPEIVPGSLRLSSPMPTELEPVRVAAILHNAGLEDLITLPVRAYVAGSDSPAKSIGETTVSLLAGESVPVRFDWIPPVPGECQVTLAWGDEEGQTMPRSAFGSDSVLVHVAAQPPLDVATVLRISNASQPLALAAFVTSLGLVAASLALAALDTARSTQ